MPQDDEKHENVVSLAEARRRQRTLHRSGASGRTADERGGRAGTPRGWRKILAYGQFILFLAVVAYMMQLCRGG